MIKEVFPHKFEIIKGEEGNLKIKIEDRHGKRGVSKIKMKDGTDANIFIINEDVGVLKNFIICKLEDDNKTCNIIYRINVDVDKLVEDKKVIYDYIKEIKDDGQTELLTFMFHVLKQHRKYEMFRTDRIKGESDHPKSNK